MTLTRTNQSQILENKQFFAIVDQNWANIWPECPSNVAILTIFALKGIPHVKNEKTIENAHFFTFFTSLLI